MSSSHMKSFPSNGKVGWGQIAESRAFSPTPRIIQPFIRLECIMKV